MRLSFKKFGSPAIGPKRGSKKIGESWLFQKPRSTRHPGRVSSHPKTVNWVSEALSYVWAMMRVLQNSMLPAGCQLTLGLTPRALRPHDGTSNVAVPRIPTNPILAECTEHGFPLFKDWAGYPRFAAKPNERGCGVGWA